MTGARSSSAVAFALLLAGCADHTDFSGTYVGESKRSYLPRGGPATEFTVPNDAVVVTMTERHYQHSSIEVKVGDCVLRSDSDGRVTSWTLSAARGACTFDVPSIGPVVVDVSGGLNRNPRSQSSRPDSVHLSFVGTAADGSLLWYTIDAKPRR